MVVHYNGMIATHTTYQAQLYLTRNAHERMDEVSRMLNSLYDAAIEHRKTAYRRAGVSGRYTSSTAS